MTKSDGKIEGMINRFAVAMLIIAALIIFSMLYTIFTRPNPAPASQFLWKPQDREEIKRRLEDRNMPANTPVEISEGKVRYRFQINGKWERL